MTEAARPNGAARRVLVVEDEYLIADYIAVILEDLGHTVVGPAPTIPEARKAIATEKLDAVLLDANLNGNSSAQIATELAARRVPFVVVTGYGSLEFASPALSSAPRVSKPFAPDELAAILNKVLAS